MSHTSFLLLICTPVADQVGSRVGVHITVHLFNGADLITLMHGLPTSSLLTQALQLRVIHGKSNWGVGRSSVGAGKGL